MSRRRNDLSRASERELWPGANELPWELDHIARSVVFVRGDRGFTLEEIGVCLGVTKERVRVVEEIALRKLGVTIDEEDVADELRGLMCGADAAGGV